MRRIVIIGAGPGGLCAGKRLKDEGFDDFVIIEQASGIGGTWWHNTYPGCRCDVASHLYSFSFAPKTDWSEPYASRDEIHAYLEAFATRFALYPHIQLNTRVESLHWEDDAASWIIQTSNGQTLTADIVISATGMFNQPACPDIPGLSEFEGALMHSARWDHGVNLEGKVVGVIGSAASAVQFVPEMGKISRQLDVYQRTPNYIGPRDNVFSAEFLAHFARDPDAAAAEERKRIERWMNAITTLDNPAVMTQVADACAKNLGQVSDDDTRRRMTPHYPFGSKRGLISSEWYPTFNNHHVRLITESIAKITANSIISSDGIERRTDVIILATGFETTRFLAAIPVQGRNGLALRDAWRDGAKAYLGITVSGFPNLFMLYGPNTNNGSIIHQLECQVDYTIRKLKMMDEHALKWIDIRQDELEQYNTILQKDLTNVGVWQAGVHDYYRAASGLIVTQWPHTMDRYAAETQRRDDEAYHILSYAEFNQRAG